MNQNSASVGHAEARLTCSKFPMSTTILTSRDNGSNSGRMTVSSFTSFSLQPPLILASINVQSQIMKHLRLRGHCALSERSQRLPGRFTGNWQGRFANVSRQLGSTGVPLFSDLTAAFNRKTVEICPPRNHALVSRMGLAVMPSARPYVNSSYSRLVYIESSAKG
jgi:4-hydroxyphenylacetate 3-hydroxylase, reductase component